MMKRIRSKFDIVRLKFRRGPTKNKSNLTHRDTSNMAEKPITITVYFFRGIPSKPFHLSPQQPTLTCEDIIWKCLLHVIENIKTNSNEKLSLYLAAFGLFDREKNTPYSPSHEFDIKDPSIECNFIVRCRPSIKNYKENNIVWDYLFLQSLDELMLGNLHMRGRSLVDPQSQLIPLCQLALLIPDKLPLDFSKTIGTDFRPRSFGLRNYNKKFSEELFNLISSSSKRFINRWIDRYYTYTHCLEMFNSVGRYNKSLSFYKVKFLDLLLSTFPDYCFNRFKAKQIVNPVPPADGDGQQTSEPVKLDIDLFIKIHVDERKDIGLYFGDYTKACDLSDIDVIILEKPTNTNSESLDWKVIIHSKKYIGMQFFTRCLAFPSEERAQAFISMLQSYISLCFDPDCDFTHSTPPSIRVRHELKSFGPRSHQAAVKLLQSENELKLPAHCYGFLLYQDENQYNCFRVASSRPKQACVECQFNGRKTFTFLLKVTSEDVLTFRSIRDVRIKLNDLFGLQLPWRRGCMRIDPDSVYSRKWEDYDQVNDSEEPSKDLTTTLGRMFIPGELFPIHIISEDHYLRRERYKTKEDEDFMVLQHLESSRLYSHFLRESINTHVKLSRVDPDSVVKYYGPFYDHHHSWLFEYPTQGQLDLFLQEYARTKLTTARKLNLALQVAKILNILENVLPENHHGNICARSFFVFKQGSNKLKLKLGDAGLRHYYDSCPMQFQDINDDRSPWLAPERRQNLKKTTMDSEIYAVGTTIIEILYTDDFRSELGCLKPQKLADCFHKNNLEKKLKPVALKLGPDDPHCPVSEVRKVYEDTWSLALRCLEDEPRERPDRREIIRILTELEARASEIPCEKQAEALMRFLPASTHPEAKNSSPSVVGDLIHKNCSYFIKPEFVKLSRTEENKLGNGAFGEVFKAKVKKEKLRGSATEDESSWQDVAIKVSKIENADTDFMKEIQIHMSLKHENIVKFIGFSHGEYIHEVYLIVELLNKDSLEKYIVKNKERMNDPSRKDGYKRELLRFLMDIVKGLVFTAGSNVVHGDLGARNVLLSASSSGKIVAKISDFGLAKMFMHDKTYYRQDTTKPLPFDSYPPEYLKEHVDMQNISFKLPGDVWSFGLLAIEVFNPGSRGRHILQQYPLNHVPVVFDKDGLFLKDMLHLYEQGRRLNQPEHMSAELYDIVSHCWKLDPRERPPFVKIEQKLKDLYNPPMVRF